MFSRNNKSENMTFNMTPIIDVVFLLIIFFMLVCQFIVAEKFDVSVPDKITTAVESENKNLKNTTVTVMFDDEGRVRYAVGSEIISGLTGEAISNAITLAVNRQLNKLPAKERIVTLRNDRNICYGDCQYALSGISRSIASGLKMAVINQKKY